MSEIPSSMKLDFSSSPTIAKFFKSKGFVRGIMGPVGSGKSYACCAEIWRRAIEQKPSPRDGIKYTRFAIVRNTNPMLRTTTLKSTLQPPTRLAGSTMAQLTLVADNIVLKIFFVFSQSFD